MLKIHLEDVDSTNTFLKIFAKQHLLDEVIVCIANNQASGYGQHNRTWISNDQSATFSVAFPVSSNSIIPALSLAVAVTVRNVMSQYSDEFLSVKWPNDIYVANGKVSGCLIELVKNSRLNCYFVIIGIGINLGPQACEDLEISWLQNISRSSLIDDIVNNLADVNLMDRTRISELIEEFKGMDYFSIGQHVIVYDYENSWQGLYQGLNQNGFPIVLLNNGVETIFNSGRASVRKILE